MRKYIKLLSLLLCAVLIFCFAACGQSETDKEENGKLSVVCTLFPQYDFVREIAGDKAEVTLLLTPGTDSHSYDPSPADMVKINECDLFIYTGELMEAWAGNIVSSLPADIDVLSVAAAAEYETQSHNHAEHGESGHDHSVDPHIWTSPVNSMEIVRQICAKLCEIDPQNASFYKANEESYLASLEEIDGKFRTAVASAEHKTIVMCDRFAMLYFCEEYGLDYIAAFDSCTSNTEPSPAVIVKIVNEIKAKNIPAVFCAELSNRKVAQSVSEQTGVKVLELHSCHNLSADDFNAGETYLTLMERNLANIKTALGVA